MIAGPGGPSLNCLLPNKELTLAETSSPVAKLKELVDGIDFAMLTTIRPDGGLHSCAMATAAIDDDGVVWFFSGSQGQKIEAIKSDSRVNLAYSDSSGQRYVSISGNAEPVRDHVKAKQLWSPLYSTWFPKGIEDPNLILLKVRVRGAEYWDGGVGCMVRLSGFAKQP